MMGNTKKEFKWFTITQYKQEEEYLSSMHRRGWKFTKVIFPGFYFFEKCEPENVTYRLDYNQDGIANKADYDTSDRENGFVIEAGRLNKTDTKEFELKKGDTVKVTHQGDSGSWYVRIGKDGEEPIFYGNTYEEFENFTVEIQEEGTYEIVCRGRNAKGNIEFEIQ